MIQLIVLLVVVGLVLYLLDQLPIDAAIRKVIRIVVILLVILWLLAAFGLLPLGGVPRFHY